MARVLFVEPFFEGSHRTFAEGLAARSVHEIVLATLPTGSWRERMRRGAQQLAGIVERVPGTFDALVVTDMLDLAAFLALTRRRFGSTPALAYFHENQFTYPRSRGTKLNSWFGQINYLSALTADAVAFNSAYHRDDFLAALATLADQPNNWLLAGSLETIAARSFVLPLGLDLSGLDAHRTSRPPGPPRVIWNHRWEFDKSPDLFARTLVRLAGEGVPFAVAVAGEPGPNPHPALVSLPAHLGGRVIHHGFASSREGYARLLWDCDVVVSTTRHEFFGIGMVEALHCGCVPMAPFGFTYPDLIPDHLHSRCLFHSEDELTDRLRALLTGPRPDPGELQASADRYDWSRMAPVWDTALDRLVASGVPSGRLTEYARE